MQRMIARQNDQGKHRFAQILLTHYREDFVEAIINGNAVLEVDICGMSDSVYDMMTGEMNA